MALLIGLSPCFKAVLRDMKRAASTDTTVLVSGETGTGKELVARTIHSLSSRRPGPFVPVDCAGLSTELFDSELFGHSRGAFTGAERARNGKIVAAAGGTLFLDGVDCLAPSCQTRLLRVIQEKEVLPLGHDRPRQVSFRLVSSLTTEFERRLEEGALRRDLYFRLNVVHLRLPPLRERREDILALAQHLLEDTARRFGKPIRRIDSRAGRVLQDYQWPGNVHELLGVIECATASAHGEVLYESDLPLFVRIGSSERDGSGKGPTDREARDREAQGERTPPQPSRSPNFTEQVAEFQRRLLVESLGRNGWSYNACGEELGLARHQVKYLCAKLGLRRSRFSRV